MAYKTLKEVLKEAEEMDFTVGAFNAHNLEMVPAMIEAAHEEGAPIIIQTSVGTADTEGMRNFVAVCKSMLAKCFSPLFLKFCGLSCT